MFTGIIYLFGEVVRIKRENILNIYIKLLSSKINANNLSTKEDLVDTDLLLLNKLEIGKSVAINGCCLTIVEINNNILHFQVMEETTNKTNIGTLEVGDFVHLEAAMKNDDSYDGHILLGHIFTTIKLKEKIINSDTSIILIFHCVDAKKYVTYKGSVAIDGVSLTVSSVNENDFSVSLIPHTQIRTLLTMRKSNWKYNAEFDVNFRINTKNYDNLVLNTYNILHDEHNLNIKMMKEAFLISKKGRFTTAPNPWVGAVIINNKQEVVARGYHYKRGLPHAEANAFLDLKEEIKCLNKSSKIISSELEFYTLYSTLEPCSTRSATKLQPPCTEEIINRKIKHVVIGILDPDTRMSGNAIKVLESNNIRTTVLNDKKIEHNLRSYIYHRKTGKPYVVGKIATSLDGKISLNNGISKWITSEDSRLDAHLLRLKSSAILVGTQTCLLDNPKLNIRLPLDHKYYKISQEVKPLRCFIDRRGVVNEGDILDISYGPVVVFTSKSVNKEVLEVWNNKNIEVVYISELQVYNKILLNLEEILLDLGKRGILQLLVEGGAELLTSFIDNNLLNELILYMAPILLGNDGVNFYQKQGNTNILACKKYKTWKVKKINNDVKIYLNL